MCSSPKAATGNFLEDVLPTRKGEGREGRECERAESNTEGEGERHLPRAGLCPLQEGTHGTISPESQQYGSQFYMKQLRRQTEDTNANCCHTLLLDSHLRNRKRKGSGYQVSIKGEGTARWASILNK